LYNTHEAQVRAISNADLIATHRRTAGDRSDAPADALLAEIECRDLDV